LSYGAVHLAIHPCGTPQGILAKANKEGERAMAETTFFDLLRQSVDTNLFDIIIVLSAILVVPFLLRFQKDPKSNIKRKRLLLSMIPFLILLLLKILFWILRRKGSDSMFKTFHVSRRSKILILSLFGFLMIPLVTNRWRLWAKEHVW
jgi:hypothetical protein